VTEFIEVEHVALALARETCLWSAGCSQTAARPVWSARIDQRV